MDIQSPEEEHRPFSPRSEEDTILESSLESFPASDPPAWVSGKDVPPQQAPLPVPEGLPIESTNLGWLKRLVVSFKKRGRPPSNDSRTNRSSCGDPH